MSQRRSSIDNEKGAPECYRGFVFEHITTRRVDQKPDVWSLGAVYSEVAIWSVLGRSGIAAYRDARREATEAIPDHEDIGCFHDKEKRLPCVDEAHFLAGEEAKPTDTITKLILSELLPHLLCDQNGRFTARQLHYNFERIINQAKAAQQPGIVRRQTEPAIPLNSTVRTHRLVLPLSKNTIPEAEFVNIETEDHPLQGATALFESPQQQQGPFSTDVTDHNPGIASRTPHVSLHRESNGLYELPRTSTALDQRADTLKPSTFPMAQITLVKVEEQMEEEQKRRSFRRLSRKKFDSLLAEVDITSNIRNLNGRDHLFLVDDSDSMGKHWSDVRRLLKALAWLVSRDDDNGMELRFLISNKKCTSKDPTKLVDHLGKTERLGKSNINERLGEVLEDYCDSWDTWKKSQERSSMKLYQTLFQIGRKPKKLSVYVLTDGIWQPKSDAADSIRPMIDRLEEWKVPSNRVGIQFIRFGDNPDSIQKLNRLDSKKQLRVSKDIVDHEPSTGNLLKMIIGAIDKDADADDDDSASEGTAAGMNVLAKDQLN